MSEIMDRLEQENPNIRQQLQDWQVLRSQNHEDPRDWRAFREHRQRQGLTDPGEQTPDEFYRNEWTDWQGVGAI